MTSFSVFEFDSYKKFISTWIENQPNQGRGQILKIAKSISVHTTLMSQVLGGNRDFSPEQVYGIALYMGLGKIETEYLVSLVHIERAGTFEYKNYHILKNKELKKQSLQISERLETKKVLTDLERSIFYSYWYYMAIWVYISVGNGQTIEQICQQFNLERALVNEVISFLINSRLAKEENGKYKNLHQHIHLEYGSPYLGRHHANWRVKALEKSEKMTNEELMFTSPFSVSKKDFERIREELVKTIQTTSKIIKKSPEEDIACLNLDLFWIK